MSRTVAEAIRTCRYNLRDRNPQSEAFSDPEYIMAIQGAVRLVAGEILLGDAWVDSFITVIAGTSVYGVPAGTSIDRLLRLRFASDGREIPIVSQETFAAMRDGDTGQTTGQPVVATLREGSTQGLEVMLWPTPQVADSISAFRTALPAPFYNAGTGKLTALPSATVIPFDDAAFEACCLYASMDLFQRMTEERRARQMLADTTADSWPSKAQQLITQSRHRRRRQQSGTHVRQARRW